MKKHLLLPLAAIIIGLSANTALAGADCGLKDSKGPGFGMEKQVNFDNMTPEQKEMMKEFHEKKKAEFQARLKLTEAQKQKIEANRQADKTKVEPIMAQLKAKKAEIKTVVYSNLNDVEKDKKITALKAEKKALKAKLEQIREANKEAFEAILTPAQRVEFEKMKIENKEKFKKQECKNSCKCPGKCGCADKASCDCKKPAQPVKK